MRNHAWRCALVALMVVAVGCASPNDPRDPKGKTAGAPASTKRARVLVELAVAIEVEPSGQRLRAWVPLPLDEPGQTVAVTSVKLEPARRHRTTRDSAGNAWLVVEVDAPGAQRLSLVLEVTRSAQAPDVGPGRTRPISPEDRRDHAPWLASGTGIPLTDATKDLAASIVALESNPLVQARKLLDWIVRTIGIREGDGPGDAARALELQTGTSADLACVLVALARASGLPARPCRGLAWDAAPTGQGPLAVRETWWAEVFAPNVGWVPVDPATAVRSRAATPKDATVGLGVLDERRIAWGRGTEVRLDPASASPAPMGVALAHAEVDGKPAVKVARQLVVRAIGDGKMPEQPKTRPSGPAGR